jgi:hypothetical protein
MTSNRNLVLSVPAHAPAAWGRGKAAKAVPTRHNGSPLEGKGFEPHRSRSPKPGVPGIAVVSHSGLCLSKYHPSPRGRARSGQSSGRSTILGEHYSHFELPDTLGNHTTAWAGLRSI